MARQRREVNPIRWPSWRYGPNGESAVFKQEADVPFGWTRKPGDIYVPNTSLSVDRDDVVGQLEALNVKIDPTWGKAHLKKVLDDCSPTR